jgi:hypothetical protein
MKIISFSLWNSLPIYCQGAIENVKLQKTIYPDWKCRFYVDNSVPQNILDILKNFNAEIVDMSSAPFVECQKMMWRFLIADDKNTERYIVRDADSRLNLREKSAVDEWEQSGLPFHIMRDHPFHGTEILGGTWGAVHGAIVNMGSLINAWLSRNKNVILKGADQHFLKEFIWPRIKNNHLAHASCCFYTGQEKPFKVVIDGFVGEQFNEFNQHILF